MMMLMMPPGYAARGYVPPGTRPVGTRPVGTLRIMAGLARYRRGRALTDPARRGARGEGRAIRPYRPSPLGDKAGSGATAALPSLLRPPPPPSPLRPSASSGRRKIRSSISYDCTL